MLTVKREIDDGMLIVYRRRKLAGIIVPVDLKGQTLYEAIDKHGRSLGKSTVYGNVLELLLKPQESYVDDWEEEN